ncbi:MAG: hypothetical protein HC921_14505 [Synechococcaceae cyanobacterium SM2_3_1]|nr:hypothetical protein [Synechococcaceae cyanobacterium SM2_3_1]
MIMVKWWIGIAAGLSVWGLAAPGEAIPGQSADQTAAWIQENAALGAEPGETLLINRTQPDGTRFSFQASVAPPGRIINPLDRETIRSERMTFFKPEGLTPQDLEAAIKAIYGPEIAADLEQAEEILRYPTPQMLSAPATDENFLERAIQGVVKQGDLLVYWMELTQNRDGTVQQGQAVVFEEEWLPKITEELSQRHKLNIIP